MDQNLTRYNSVAVALHWLIAALMIYMLLWGEDLIRHPTGTYNPSLHASLGLSILVLSLVRLGWRLANPAPALPATMKPWEVMLSHVTHWAFYVLMIGIPLTGMMSFTAQLVRDPILSGASIFGMFAVPSLPNLGGAGGGLHGLLSNLAKVLIILHVLAALKHQFWDKDNLLKRMSLR